MKDISEAIGDYPQLKRKEEVMNFMAALKIVLELAEGNLLEDENAISPELKEEQHKQELAIKCIKDFRLSMCFKRN